MIDCMACLALGGYLEYVETTATGGVTHGLIVHASRWAVPRCAFDRHGKPTRANWFDDAFDIYPTDLRYNPP